MKDVRFEAEVVDGARVWAEDPPAAWRRNDARTWWIEAHGETYTARCGLELAVTRAWARLRGRDCRAGFRGEAPMVEGADGREVPAYDIPELQEAIERIEKARAAHVIHCARLMGDPTVAPLPPLPPDAEGVGWVYLIEANGMYKIGWTKDVARRVQRLQTGSPHPLRVLARVRGTLADERALHRRYARKHRRGEWFTGHRDILHGFVLMMDDPTRSAVRRAP